MNDVEVVVPLRLPAASPRYLLLGRRAGGRRYLSEDLEELSAAAALIAEQIDQHREAEMRRLMAQAELRALQSQIHPHFLFNAFNTLYGLIPGSAQGARDTVLNLADIFRYFLETKKAQVPLEEEMHIVRAYLDIERLRLGDKLQTEFRIAPEALSIPIPILSVQPLVENAVKHAIAPFTSGGRVTLEASVDPFGQLSVRVSDTGPGFGAKRAGGVGLENVTRRLELSYGADARIDIQSTPSGSIVQFCIPVDLKPRSIEVSQ
jgi:LytS/YehU family sensor histidine kinase